MDSNLFSGGPSNGNNYDLNLFYPQQQSGYQYPSFSQMGIFPGFQNVPYLYGQQHLNPMPEQMNIKLENMFRNQPFYPSSKGRNQKKFESNKVKSISKNTQEALEKLLAPLPQTKHKVAYFDPNNAPVLTTDKQFLVQNQESKKVKIKQYQKEYQQNNNELDSEQSDSNPFIVFRYRRIKKKYKKYMKNSDDFELLSEEQSESLSESESQEPFVKEERNEKKNDSLEFPREKQKIEESMNSKK